MKRGIVLLAIIVVTLFAVNAQENKVDLFIEALSEQEAYDIKGGGGCSPGDIIITVKSDIKLLSFDSNVMDIASVSYDADKGEYVFCHYKESFWLTVASPNHISKKTYIDGKNSKYAFRIVEKAATGKIHLKTTPNNALIDFGFSGQSPQLSSYPIEMNAGEYKIRISKNGYQSIDTAIVVPSDGSTRQMEVSLRPLFGKIHLDISSADKAQFQILPVIDIDTAHVNLADLHIKEKLHSFDAAENVQYFKLYEGGYVPLPDGSYNVTVNSPGFKTYNTQVLSNKGGTTPLVVKMEPIVGYLTVIDHENAVGADVILDEQVVGKVPLFKYPVRVGNHKVKLQKSGFMTSEEDYAFMIQENTEYDLPINMHIYKEFNVVSDPSSAEVLINGKRYGFTPLKVSLPEGDHELIMRKSGFMDVIKKIKVGIDRTPIVDTLNYRMEKTHPTSIHSERDGLRMIVKQDDNIIFKNLLTPTELLLAPGTYMLELFEDKSRRFKGEVKIKDQDMLFLPCYSKGTFTVLSGDYYLLKPKAMSENENYYNLLASGDFGKFNLFPGVATSIIKANLFQVNEAYKGLVKQVPEAGEYKFNNYMLSSSFMFLNGELRLGGSILRQLDVAFLGSFAWFPSLSILGLEEWGANHISGKQAFVGIELSSRVSPFNMNIKIGQDIYKGDYNFLYEAKGKKAYHKQAFELSSFGIKVGFTLGQKPSKGNNMIRLWHKPFVANY